MPYASFHHLFFSPSKVLTIYSEASCWSDSFMIYTAATTVGPRTFLLPQARRTKMCVLLLAMNFIHSCLLSCKFFAPGDSVYTFLCPLLAFGRSLIWLCQFHFQFVFSVRFRRRWKETGNLYDEDIDLVGSGQKFDMSLTRQPSSNSRIVQMQPFAWGQPGIIFIRPNHLEALEV